ncbi:hypothetical protein, partial [Paenibacillus dokdonensis]|uniref:hypothetical protein n=1 Tax=Paenibacillus dokdonensis TaxID=2567944 RepID=UPI003D275389
HFETDEIKSHCFAPPSIQTEVLNPMISRFGFASKACISLVVQFSKIKFFLVSASTILSQQQLLYNIIFRQDLQELF